MTARSFFPGRALGLSLAIVCSLLTACNPGHRIEPETPRPEAVREFATLYAHNCSGCHGADGQNGPAIDLANPVYQAVIDDANLRRVIVSGQAGTQMPAFGQSAGGMLNDAQIDALVHGMRDHWQKPGLLNGQNLPPYTAVQPGDAARGRQAFSAYCAPCHGSGLQHGPKASSILDPSLLALLSDSALRSIILAGRPDLGMPDWRHRLTDRPDIAQPGRPMSEQDITDVVTWLGSQRSLTPGQPYPQQQP